jgi:RHS repeat-associated protein
MTAGFAKEEQTMKIAWAIRAPLLLVGFGSLIHADLVPGANQLGGPAYVQPFSYVTVNGDGTTTTPFPSDLSCCIGTLNNNFIVDIVGNFQYYGAPSGFAITGVTVTQGGSSFNPAFGLFNFDGQSSVTLTDPIAYGTDQVTFSAATNDTYAFAFYIDPSYQYSFSFTTTGLSPGYNLVFDDAETSVTPEPGRIWMFGSGIVLLALLWRIKLRPLYRPPVPGKAFFFVLPLLLLVAYVSLRGATLTTISPTVGQAGDVVVISGSGFPATPVVKFGPNRAAVLSSTSGQLTVQVPPGQPLGPASVTVSGSNSLTFVAASRSKIVVPTNPSVGAACGQACSCKATDEKSCGCDKCEHQNTCGEANSSKCVSQGLTLGGNLDGSGGSIYGERGEFYQQTKDLTIPGRPGGSCAIQYSLEREYRSDSIRSGPMGNKWDLNNFENLVLEGDGSIMHQNLGRNDHYLLNNQGNFVAPPEFYTTLVKNPDGSFTLTYRNRTVKNFDKTGKLENVNDRDGNTMSYSYNAQNRLASVTDSLGRPITYTYDGSGRLIDVTDFIGRTVTYGYDSNNNLISATTPPVTGTPNGNNFPSGRTTRYTYDSNHNLLTVTRPNEVAASGPASVTNVYNSSGQVIQQIYGGTNASGVAAGGTYTYTYTTLNAGVSSSDPNLPVMRTQQTDPNGNVTQYDYNRLSYPVVIREFTRGIRSTDPSVYITNMQYNADGRMTEITFPHGNTVQYTYDEGNPDRFQQGNLLQETRMPDARGGDQSFITTTYTYEPSYNHIQTMTEPRGNDPSYVPQNGGMQSAARYTTTYTYDASGNMLKKQEPTVTLPGGSTQLIETDYTYNSFGQMTSQTDPEGNVTTYEYCPTATPSCSTPDPNGGGYLQTKIVDSTTSGRRTETTPPLQITTQYFYDAVGNEVREIDGRGNDTLYTYNQLNELVETQAESPFRYITYTYYDYNGNIVERDIENKVVTETDGRPQFISGGNFNTADGSPAFFINRYTYDILDRTVQQNLDATGSTPSTVITQYRYDPDGNRVLETYSAGNSVSYQYDERNLPFQTTRGSGSPGASTTRYDYDTNRNLVDTVDGRGFTTNYTYDGFDRRTQTTDPVGGITTSHYDPAGNVILQSRTGQPGGPSPSNNSGTGNVLLHQSDSLYDELSRRYQYDEQPINGSSFVASGVTTTRPPSETTGPLNPGDISTQFIYDRDSRLVQQIGDDLTTTSTVYDGASRRVMVTDPSGNTSAFTYDANNNLIQTVDTDLSQKSGVSSETFTTTNVYDAHNRLTSVTDNCGDTRTTAYDSRDNATHSTDAKYDDTAGCPGSQNPLGNSTRYYYDGLSRHVQTVEDLRVGGVGSGVIDTTNAYDASGHITTTAVYDGDSRLTAFTDNNGNTTSYMYDALNRRTQETMADGTTRSYTYDPDDNVLTLTDNNGSVTTNTYDRVNRLIQSSVVPASGVIGTTLNTYQYDGLSRPTRATDNNNPSDSTTASTVTYAYDSLSRLVEETQNGRAVDSAWTAQSRRNALTYPNARQLVYTYDALERVQTIQDSGASTNIAQYTYMGANRVLLRQSQNGTQLTYLDSTGTTDVGYDGVRRTVQREDVNSSNSVLVGFNYAYDRNGNKLTEGKLHATADSEAYTYDSLSRGTAFSRGTLSGTTIPSPSKTQAWTLDGVGNWRVNTINGVIENRSVNSVNEYSSIGLTSDAYDHDGNLINDGTLGYQWDYRNRLRLVCSLPTPSASCATPGASVIAVYSYDAMNRRTAKAVTNSGVLNGTTNFYYSGWRTVEERSGADVLIQQYVYGIGQDELLVLDRNLDGDNSAIGPGDQRLFYHQNALNSAFALTNSSGAVVEGYQYDEYGTPTVFEPDFATVLPSTAFNNPYLFTGQRLDLETGLFYYKNRYYSTTLGRFLSRDPAGYVRGNGSVANGTSWVLNLYIYGRDEPTRYVDPDGLTEYDVVAVPSDDASLAGEKPRITRAGGTVIDFANRGNLDDVIAGLAEITSQGSISRFFRGQHCIRTLEIHAHANPDIIDGITTQNAADIGAKLKQRVKWCCPCTIYLAGCNTGLGDMAQRLSTATGCTVYGSRGYLSGTHSEGNENCSKECDYEGHHYDAYPGSIDGRGADCWKSFAPGAPEQGGGGNGGGNVKGKKVKGPK